MSTRRQTVAALGAFIAAALAATWPLVLHLSHRIAGGLGDPLLNATVLAWDADRVRHGLRGFWDAPYLFPHHRTLAYAEHLIGVAVFITPIEWISGNPILSYNIAYIGSYVLAGFAMFLLARALCHRADAAMLGGLAYALTPYRFAQTTHLQVLMHGWMAVGLLALHRYLESGSRWWMAAFAAAYLLLGLSNGYYLYFFLLPIAVVLGVEMVWPRLPRRRIVVDAGVAGLAIAVAVAPVAFVYYALQRQLGFARSAGELTGLSARVADYFRVASGAWTWGGLVGQGAGERQLFHGFVVIVCAAIGAGAIVWRRGDGEGAAWRRTAVTYTVIALLAVWLSMGPVPGSPYGLLFRLLPGFNGLRVPARLSVVVILALSVLAAGGLAWLFARLPKKAVPVTAIALGAIILLEGQHGVGISDAVSWTDRSWDRVAYEWLRTSPPGAAIELNITQQDDFHPYTVVYQFNTLRHRHPIVNGYSGWKSMLQEWLGAPASPLREPGFVADALRGLRAIGVRYVLLHEATFSEARDAARLVSEIQAAGDQIAAEQHWPETWAWRLSGLDVPKEADPELLRLDLRTLEVHASHQEGRLPFAFDGDVDTRWMTGEPQGGAEWIHIRLAQAVNVARLRIATPPRSQIDYPRGLRIESIDPAGATTTLFDGRVVDRMIRALAGDERHAAIDIDLPANRTSSLRLRQTGRSTAWWSVHELSLWTAQSPARN
jgi:hypothetical protein